MAEHIVFDPPEVAAGRTALDITPWIEQAGMDWGDAQINTFMADRDRGSFPVDFTVPNRDITVPLRFSQTTGGTTVNQARANIQAKVALFQKEGGWIKRVTASGGTVYADVVDAATHGFASIAGWESAQNVDVDSSVSLTCIPDFYQDEITLSDHAETTAAELVFTETSIQGDYPARVRVVVDDDQGADKKGLIWAFRSRYYDSASTAALQYEAEALGPLDTATRVAVAGASGGTMVQHGALATGWTPVLSTNLGGTQFMTHRGTYRLLARMFTTSGTAVQARFVWDVGDLVNPVENDAWRFPPGTGLNYYLHDFGEVRLDAAPIGTHRWQGQIQARGDAGGEVVIIDKIWMVSVDEGMGVLSAPAVTTAGLSTYAARDEFNQTAGALTGKVATVGGTWTVGAAGGSTAEDGDADDFSASGTPNFNVTRNPAGADSSLTNGRYVLLNGSSTIAAINVQVDIGISTLVNATDVRCGLLARFGDTDNWMMAVIHTVAATALGLGASYLEVIKRVAGTATVLSTIALTPGAPISGTNRILLGVNASGFWVVYTGPAGGSLIPRAYGQDDVLKTGGVLDDGRVGIYDATTVGAAGNRTYDNFSASQPPSDAVIYAARSAQITTDGSYRLDTSGTAYGPVSSQVGDLPRLPVAGLEGRTSECLIKVSRGDFNQIPDTLTGTDYGDNILAQVFYRPCYLNVGTI